MDETSTPSSEALRAMLQSASVPLWVVTPTGLELEARFTAWEPERNRIVVEIPQIPQGALGDSGKVLLALAVQDRRWEGTSSIQLKLERTRFALTWPHVFTERNRRSAPRVILRPPGQVRATLSLGPRGPLLTGDLLDLSTGGFCMRLERALDMETRARLDPASLPLQKDQTLEKVELAGLRTDPLEASGILRDVDHGALGYHLHLQFRAMLRADRAFLDMWISTRQESDLIAYTPIPDRAAQRKAALLRLKKRLRVLAVCMADTPERAALIATLVADGYERVHALSQPAALEGSDAHAVLVTREADRVIVERIIHGRMPILVADGDVLAQLEASLGLLQGTPAPTPHLLGAFKAVGLAIAPDRLSPWMTRLQEAGFHHLIPMGGLPDLAMAMAGPSPDVVIVDYGLDEASTLRLVEFFLALRPWPLAVVTPPSAALTERLNTHVALRRIDADTSSLPVLMELLST